MAIVVVGKDTNQKKKTTCSNCASILEYTLADTRKVVQKDYTGCSDTYRKLICPVCKDDLNVPLY